MIMGNFHFLALLTVLYIPLSSGFAILTSHEQSRSVALKATMPGEGRDAFL